MQTDPIGYADGINWYLYCRNNPLVYVDPSGLSANEPNGPNEPNGMHKESAGEYWWYEHDNPDVWAVALSEKPPNPAAASAAIWGFEYLGDKRYAYEGAIDNFPSPSYKCNKFVRDAFVKGAGVEYPHYPPGEWPYKANAMANPNVDIENYPVVEGGQLKVGDIVSFPAEVGSGHTAIYVGGGRLIQATPQGGVEVTRITERGGYENMVVRRYKP